MPFCRCLIWWSLFWYQILTQRKSDTKFTSKSNRHYAYILAQIFTQNALYRKQRPASPTRTPATSA